MFSFHRNCISDVKQTLTHVLERNEKQGISVLQEVRGICLALCLVGGTGCKVPLLPAVSQALFLIWDTVWHCREVGRTHSFAGLSPCCAVVRTAQDLLSTVRYSCWIAWTLLQLGSVCVVPVRDYFLYNEAVTTKCTKVNEAFPSLRYMPPISPRITCVRLRCRRASSNHSHHCTLPSLSATQLILTACLRPSHSMSSIT